MGLLKFSHGNGNEEQSPGGKRGGDRAGTKLNNRVKGTNPNTCALHLLQNLTLHAEQRRASNRVERYIRGKIRIKTRLAFYSWTNYHPSLNNLGRIRFGFPQSQDLQHCL